MATSARTAALANQRNPYTSFRVLTPRDSKLNSIAKKTAQQELAIMVERYNDGLVGNTEMQSFLQTQLSNPGLGAEDKADVENYIRDFDLKIRKDALEAVYKGAQEYSLEKVTAAQALANFYSQRAATLSPGTPAQSTALENAGIWQNTATAEQNKVEKQARSNQRYQMELEAYKNPPSTSQRAYELAQMYQTLSQQAQADGDVTEANRLMSLAQQQQSQGDAYAQAEFDRKTKLEQQAAKQEISNDLNSAKDAFADKRITAQEYYDFLVSKEEEINATGDWGLINSLNTARATAEKKAQSEKTGSFSQMDQEDFKYSKDIKDAQEEYKRSGNSQQYIEELKAITLDRADTIVNRIKQLEAIAEENPNAKIYYNGSKQDVTNLLNTFYKIGQELQPQMDSIQNGTFAVLALPPSQFSKTGTYKSSGSPVESYEIIDVNAIPEEYKGLILPDEEGVYRQAYRKRVPVSMQEYENAQLMGDYSFKMDEKTGQPYRLTNELYVDLYQPGTGKLGQTVQIEEGKPIKTLDTIQRDAEQVAENTAVAKTKLQEGQQEQATFEATRNQPAINLDRRPITQKIQEAVQPVVSDVIQKAEPAYEQVKQAIPEPVKQAVSQAPIQYVASKLPEPVRQTVEPIVQKVTQPIQNFINPPSYSAPSTPPSGGTYKPTIQVNNKTLVKHYEPTGPNAGITYQPLKPPTPAPAPAPTQNLGTKILNVVKQSPFNFLKGLF